MDWYRKKTWTEIDKEDFYTKLGRARKDNRAQYLKIQAIEFIETKEPKNLENAETLLNKLLTDYSDNRIEKSPTLHALGDIYKIRQDFDKAMDYYKMSLDYEKEFPNVITQSYLNYSELVIKTKKTEQYNFVEQLIEKEVTNSLFPIVKYKGFSMLSIIKRNKGEIDKAQYFEDLANENANAKTSGLRYHKYLGIVKERDKLIDKILKRK